MEQHRESGARLKEGTCNPANWSGSLQGSDVGSMWPSTTRNTALAGVWIFLKPLVSCPGLTVLKHDAKYICCGTMLHATCCAVRVALFGCLMMAPQGVALLGPCCKTWGIPARGTTLRSWINPLGVPYECVARGNMTVCRPDMNEHFGVISVLSCFGGWSCAVIAFLHNMPYGS